MQSAHSVTSAQEPKNPRAELRPEAAFQTSARPLPRVALLTGGGDRPYALGMAGTLIARRINFDFIGSDETDSADLHTAEGVRFLNLRGDQSPSTPFSTKVFRVLIYYGRLFRYALGSKAAIFHLLWHNKFEYLDRTLVLLFYKCLGKRIVFTAHNVNIRKRDGNDTVLNRFTLRCQYRLVDHVLVHTERMKRELIQDFGISCDKVSVIPFGINSTVPDTALTRDDARARLGLAASDRVLLFFGNIAPYKGVEFLIEAALQLVRSGEDLRLIIAGRPKGSEDYWAQIRSRIDSTELAARTMLRIEYVPDADTEIYFKAADVLILPYVHIFQSGVLFLGYNFGLPTIATDVGSLKDDIIEGETGFVCAPKDSSSLAAAIQRFMQSSLCSGLPVTRRKIQEFARHRYSWDKVGVICEGVYSNLNDRAELSDRIPSLDRF